MFEKILKASLLILILTLGLTSCTDEANEFAEVTPNTSNTALAVLSDRANSTAGGGGDGAESDATFTEELCFTFNYPITAVMPDGDKHTINSDEELDALLDEYFEANPEAEEYPMVEFPVDVTKKDGTVVSVDNDETLCDIMHECWEEDYDDYDDFDDFDQGDFEDMILEAICFDFVYPITVVLTDGTTATANNDTELESILYEAYATDSTSTDMPDLQYPVTVTLEDGSTQDLQNTEDLEVLIESCFDGFFEEDCVTIKYPVELQIPGGSTVTVNNEEEEYQAIDAYFEANPEAEEYPSYVYPITVLDKEGNEVQVDSEEALEQLLVDCYGEDDDDSSNETGE